MLTAEELLAGSRLTFEVEIPSGVLNPGDGSDERDTDRTIRLRPLTVHDLQLIARATKENDTLMAVLMVHRALVDMEMSVTEVASMHAGLMQYLLQQVNRISGIDASSDYLASAAAAPLAKAAFTLAQEFGWTPQEVNELTLGQILLHMQMLQERSV